MNLQWSAGDRDLRDYREDGDWEHMAWLDREDGRWRITYWTGWGDEDAQQAWFDGTHEEAKAYAVALVRMS